MKVVSGGVTKPMGFRAAGIYAGIKSAAKKDLALLVSDVPALAKAVFTTNTVKAAPVLWDIDLMNAQEQIRAVVVNSGNANACTGSIGVQHVRKTAQTCARCLGLSERQVFVSSTGVIGLPLPIDTVCRGLEESAGLLSDSLEAGNAAAEAILTTDTRSKQIAVQLDIDGTTVKIGGMAKGSGMIHPNMATMLAFITTDAVVDETTLDHLLHSSVRKTYNMISVDRDTSTNDTVLLLANGLAGNAPIQEGTLAYNKFKEALDFVNTHLATEVVKDGEGATKFLEVTVKGAASEELARKLAKGVVTSNLVKTAFFGSDANWGRILAAMGQAGSVEWTKVSIRVTSDAGSLELMKAGEPQAFDETQAKAVLKEYCQQVQIQVGEGLGEATAWGCDLSYEYVKINGDYRT